MDKIKILRQHSGLYGAMVWKPETSPLLMIEETDNDYFYRPDDEVELFRRRQASFGLMMFQANMLLEGFHFKWVEVFDPRIDSVVHAFLASQIVTQNRIEIVNENRLRFNVGVLR